MNDLNVIARQNAKAVKAEIPKAVAQGHHVLAKYAGLTFIDFSKHATREDAEVARNEYTAVSPDRSGRIHSPEHAAA